MRPTAPEDTPPAGEPSKPARSDPAPASPAAPPAPPARSAAARPDSPVTRARAAVGAGLKRALQFVRSRQARPILAGALAVVLVVVGLVLVFGSGGTKRNPAVSGVPGKSGCGQVIHEALDPGSTLHVLPGAKTPHYSTDPPTSGPHEPGLLPEGIVDHPLPKPVQVGALEAGQVLVQYRNLSAAEQTEIKKVAGPLVVVAPNPDLPNKVVLTAWLIKLRCSTFEVGAVTQFARVFQGHPVG